MSEFISPANAEQTCMLFSIEINVDHGNLAFVNATACEVAMESKNKTVVFRIKHSNLERHTFYGIMGLLLGFNTPVINGSDLSQEAISATKYVLYLISHATVS